jgi:hypothetical protein
MSNYSPAIVVVAYNRTNSLKRLLTSLNKAVYHTNVMLVISIDKSDNNDVCILAENFEWNYGDKVLIRHDKNLGLKNHILSCGDLTSVYGSIILLEDDLYVSPFFYIYATKALNFYCDDSNIAGISLYSHSLNIHVKLPFYPIKGDSNVFFLQMPSSWGQAWTREQWDNFSIWFNSDKNNNNYHTNSIPENIADWPNTSWLKIFAKYIIENNKYFVYPYDSLTTNFGDTGIHFRRKFWYVQVILQSVEINYQFDQFENSNCVYDAYFELLPSKLRLNAKFLSSYDFEVDLYGYKSLLKSNKPYFLTTHYCKTYEKSFGLDFKPIEFNIIEENIGQNIFLVKNTDFKYSKIHLTKSVLFEYYYRMPVIGELFNLLLLKIRQNINDKIS